MQVVWSIAKQIDVLAYMNKIAVEMIKIDEIENIGGLHNKKKNIFKQRDDQIAVTIELAVNSGMRLVDIDF